MGGHLDPSKLHVTFAPGTSSKGPPVPRAYTLTHSDFTGELFLTIGADYDRKQISGLYTRIMRDEVLAQWGETPGPDEGLKLEVHCHVNGGLVMGTSGSRYRIFRHHLPLVLEAFRHGDREMLLELPELDEAPVWVVFHSTKRRYDFAECWGRMVDYRMAPASEPPLASMSSRVKPE